MAATKVISMELTIEKVTEAAMRLAPRDRALLARTLISSLDESAEEDVEQAWDEEIQKRLREIKDGQVQGQPFDEAMNEIRDEFR